MRGWYGAFATYLVGAFIASAATASSPSPPFDPVAAGHLPRYIFFNMAPGVEWSQDRPETFTPASCAAVVETLGTRGDGRLKVGVSFVFSILETPPDTLARSLARLLDAAGRADVPVLVTLDGQNWWERRSDLWNWWDPTLPGFDPRNRYNVEWTGWGPEHAVKIGWRNWGSQMRVRPAPNLASPRFLAEHVQAYRTLIPIIVGWHKRLPPDKKYLFGGVKIGWEASINVNAYYYDDGNSVFEKSPMDASKDPTDHDVSKGWTFGHARPLGYAAVRTAGFKRSGDLRKEDIERVVHDYLRTLCMHAHRLGIPRHLVFTHQGGTYAPYDKHLSFKPAVNEYAIPGWSFYTHDPPEIDRLAADMASAGCRQWAAAEWYRGGSDPGQVRKHFEAALGFKQCRFICVYNWHGFKKLSPNLAAVRTIIKEGSLR